jgi:hypothetical protein
MTNFKFHTAFTSTAAGRTGSKHREDNIHKYPRNSMRRMNYPEFSPKGIDI